MKRKKLIAILGPTSSGKSDLAVEIAIHHNGEVISADSRQVYKHLDIGSGKITSEEMRGIPHHLLDISDPSEQITVSEYKELAEEAIKNIQEKEKIPIVAGGSGMYIDSVVYNTSFPEVPPQKDIREKLENLTNEELFNILKKKDIKRAEIIDPNNRRRLIRAIEVLEVIGEIPPQKKEGKFNTLLIGLDMEDRELRERIDKRLINRLSDGLIEEVEDLNKNKNASWERMEELGLEYRYVSRYLRGQLNQEELVETLKNKIWQYAKRQRTWFKRDKNIEWFDPKEKEKILKKVEKFVRS